MPVNLDESRVGEPVASAEPAQAVDRRLSTWFARLLFAAACVLLVVSWQPPIPDAIPVLPAAVSRYLPPPERTQALASEAVYLLGVGLMTGILGWWAIPGRRWWLQPARLVVVAAIVAGLLAVRHTTPLGFLLAAVAAGLAGWGFLFGASLSRGIGTSLRFLVGNSAVLLASVAGVTLAATDVEPTVAKMPTPTAADRERWKEMLASARNQERAGPVELELTRDDLNLMTASWLAARDSRLAVDFDFRDAEIRSRTTLPVHVPALGGRFLNLLIQLEPAIADQELSLKLARLKIGSCSLPAPLRQPAADALLAVLNSDADLRRTIASFDSITAAQDRLVLVCDPGRASLAIASAFDADVEATPELTATVRVYFSELIDRASQLPEGDERFLGLVRTAFEIARERSKPETAALENQAALIALGIQIGDPRVRRLAGFAPDEPIPRFKYPFDNKVTLRGRNDLARHFFVSAALRALSSRDLSYAVGLIKEQLDAADGGSGFSFADLAADVSGVQLAHLATNDKSSAATLQTRLSKPFTVADLMPEIDGLPENLTYDEFAEQFGSLTDPRFLKMTVEIQQRMSKCEILDVKAKTATPPGSQ